MINASLNGKVALVTGGSRGLGEVIAKKLASLGAKVAITYVSSEQQASSVIEAIKAEGGEAIAIKSDQADMSAAKPLVQQVIRELGGLDILVNNAAIAVQGQKVDDPELRTEALDKQWQINVMGTIAVTRAAAQVISNEGRIIFVGSLLGTRVPFIGAADYAGTKAALAGYARGVARDLGSRNITANVVQPGVMPTQMANEVLGDSVPEALLDIHPIRRIANLDEVATLVTYLAGPDAAYITGSVIDVAGGAGV